MLYAFYHTIEGNLPEEVIIDDGTMRDRFVVCHNPEEAGRDKQVREWLLAQLTDAIEGSNRLSGAERARLHGELCAKRGLKRFLRTTKTGLLRIERAAVNSEEHLDVAGSRSSYSPAAIGLAILTFAPCASSSSRMRASGQAGA
jgi:hypothetical protein